MNLKNSEEGLLPLLIIFALCAIAAIVVWRVTDVDSRVHQTDATVNQGLESGEAIESQN